MILCVRNDVTEFTEMHARSCISAPAKMHLSCVVQERDAGLNVRETVDCVCRTEEVVWTLCVSERGSCVDTVCVGQRKLCGHCVCRTEEVVWTLCVSDRGSCVDTVCVGQRKLCGHCVCV